MRLTSPRLVSRLFLAGQLFVAGCNSYEPPSTPTEAAPAVTPVAAPSGFNFKPKPVKPAESTSGVPEFPEFVDVAAELGVNHVYQNGASPRALMVESTGGGSGWLDFDRDGHLDLYLTQGGDPCPTEVSGYPQDALYRQSAKGVFMDVFPTLDLEERGYGHGVAVGDFDNDGFDDIYIANVGRKRLLRNSGDGTFEDVTEDIEGDRDAWSSTVAWGDVDRDGDLDLYVCNYAAYDPCHPIECLDNEGIPSICHPRNVDPEPDQFFVNLGDGRFVESSQRMGLHGPGNKGLGVVIADMNADDWPDIYVANDTTANFLFINDGTGEKFEESAMLLGGAYSATGEAQASMGVAFGDYDGNGFPDLLLTHFTGEHNTLYRNLGPQGLQDVSGLTGLRAFSLDKLGFGTVMSDFNADGHMDLLVTNGHIDPRYVGGEEYEMVPQLFSFDGNKWHERPAKPGDFFTRKLVGRSVASGDYDRDGRLDLCVVHHNSPAAILHNESNSRTGLRLAPVGMTSNRSGYQTKVVVTSNGRRMTQEVAGGTSYAAAHERVLHFGLGSDLGPWQVEVEWPSGTRETHEFADPRGVYVLLEGQRPLHRE